MIDEIKYAGFYPAEKRSDDRSRARDLVMHDIDVKISYAVLRWEKHILVDELSPGIIENLESTGYLVKRVHDVDATYEIRWE